MQTQTPLKVYERLKEQNSLEYWFCHEEIEE